MKDADVPMSSMAAAVPMMHSVCAEPKMECMKPTMGKHHKKSKKRSSSESEPEDLMEARAEQTPALAELGATKEFAETGYFGVRDPKAQTLVNFSDFWADYADHLLSDPDKPFLSSNFTDVCNTLTEVVAALALLDLPYKSGEHGYKSVGDKATELKAASNFVIFKKEVKEAKDATRTDVLVAQRYLQGGDTGPERTAEFLVNCVYTCEVIVTNISSHNLELDVLVQIPQGALPLGKSPYQRSHSVQLNSYTTTKFVYQFYFPRPGKFLHFPANVSLNSSVVARAGEKTITVVKTMTTVNEASFRDAVATANADAIINIIKRKPIEKNPEFDWEGVYWLLKDVKFFNNLIAVLKQQGRFESTVWSYALYHKKDDQLISEYLNSHGYFKNRIGHYFDSRLVRVRPKDCSLIHHDYHPMINPRAHSAPKCADQRFILNDQLRETYREFMEYLVEKPVLELRDRMELAYYLLIQDRVADALAVFGKINEEKDVPKEGTLRLQYDYMAAYVDFYAGRPKFAVARRMVEKYANYPVLTWRLMFQDVDQQLKECDGVTEADVEASRGVKEEAKAGEPSLNLVLEGKEAVIQYHNMPEVVLNYYLIDLEVLFSRSPFLSQDTGNFSFVKANTTQKVTLDPAAGEHREPIPAPYLTKNVVVEAVFGPLRRRDTYFSTSLKVQIYEKYGELKVTDDKGVQLSQVYVKVFARTKTGGPVVFYKDGYTDIRGSFDYVSLNASNVGKTEKFALFVFSDTHGSLIRECEPPAVTRAEQEEDEQEELGEAKTRVREYYKMKKCAKSKKC